MTGVARARKHFLTFEGTATNSESPLHSTFIRAISAPPEITQPQKDANISRFFMLGPCWNAIRVRAQPGPHPST